MKFDGLYLPVSVLSGVIGNHTVDGCWEVIDPVNSVMKYSLYTP